MSEKLISVEIEYRANIEDARKFVNEQIEKRHLDATIKNIKKNNWLTFTRDGGSFWDVTIDLNESDKSAQKKIDEPQENHI